VGRRSA
jgi:hydroxyacylglutathione hydrolase